MFSGPLPVQLSTLANLSAGSLSFANTQVSGAVPAELASTFGAGSAAWTGTCVTGASSPQPACTWFEQAVMIDLYVATSASGGWRQQTGWFNYSSHPCSWYGLTCDSGNSTIMYGPAVVVVVVAQCLHWF